MDYRRRMGGHQKLRFALIGGGEGAFIGAVHRLAAELDSQAELSAGCFSSDAERSVRAGEEIYGLPSERCYDDVDALVRGELAQPGNKRIHFAIVATPNHTHFPIAHALLQGGFHVVCDKPLTVTSEEAASLASLSRDRNLQLAVTYNYTGYPMVREARELVASGALGEIRRVQCEYLQGWLATAEETEGNKQAQWRTDPSRAGAAGCFGDIGSHAENLLHFVTGLEIDTLCADLTTFVPGRALDDDGNVLLRFAGGARGVISASQIAVGEENALTLRVYGTEGALAWSQQEPNSLLVRWPDRPFETRRTGGPGSSAPGARVPAGHPEGYLEAFANLYVAFCATLRGEAGESFPDVRDGLRGVRFIEQVVASSTQGGAWMSMAENQ